MAWSMRQRTTGKHSSAKNALFLVFGFCTILLLWIKCQRPRFLAHKLYFLSDNTSTFFSVSSSQHDQPEHSTNLSATDMSDAGQSTSTLAEDDANQSTTPTPRLPPGDTDEYVALCIAVKDQSLDLVEYFQHHYHHLGIRRFYLMDDGSSPPLSTFNYSIPSSAITHTYFSAAQRTGKNMQRTIYDSCVSRWRGRHTWMGFLDADEYLEMRGSETLVEFLRSFDGNDTVGALGVQWRTHSSSGLLKRPPQGCRKGFTDCIVDDPQQDNRHIKSFVKLAFYEEYLFPHNFRTANGSVTVGEQGDVVESAFRVPITRSRWALHHYVVKSKEEYQAKSDRGNPTDDPKTWDFWNHIEGMEHVQCPELSSYVP